MSEFYELVKEKYKTGKWTKKMLEILVKNNKITNLEYQKIIQENLTN